MLTGQQHQRLHECVTVSRFVCFPFLQAIHWTNPEALYCCQEWNVDQVTDWCGEVAGRAAALAAAQVCDRPTRKNSWKGGQEYHMLGGDMSRIEDAVVKARSKAIASAQCVPSA